MSLLKRNINVTADQIALAKNSGRGELRLGWTKINPHILVPGAPEEGAATKST